MQGRHGQMGAPDGDAGRRKALADTDEQRLDFDVAERLANGTSL